MILTQNTVESVSLSLAKAPDRVACLIKRVLGPERRRLSEMGLVEGAEVSVVNRSGCDRVVIKIGGCRLAMARGMADCVLVK